MHQAPDRWTTGWLNDLLIDTNSARGLKATISNPKVSDEAKEHAKERLEAME